MEKKLPLTPPEAQSQGRRSTSKRTSIAIWTLIPFWFVLYFFAYTQEWPRLPLSRFKTHDVDALSAKHHCPQAPALVPAKDIPELEQMYEYLSSAQFHNASVERLSGSVQIRTESFDDLGEIGEDKRWDVMYAFADYLTATFPRVHEKLRLEKVNTHGLLYTWIGYDGSLKPTLLMAHQDVVPVPDSTVDAWTHPPFSGHYDGKYIWGRGASDCKNQLIAILETVELLLDAGFAPRRTLLLSFGFDEEVSGPQGAGHLAPFLLDRYGEDGIAALVDEGATFDDLWGKTFAIPGVGEKGYTDVEITVRMPGGHSSIPTDHTSIGVASEIITALEAEQYPLELADENPFLAQLYCGAEHAPDFPHKLKKLLPRSKHGFCAAKKDSLAREAAKLGPGVKYLMQTSQAVDVISGGVKVNALPERTSVTVNHRINIGSTRDEVYKHIAAIVKPIAKKHGLDLHAFVNTTEAPNSITLAASPKSLDVAPITPTEVGEKVTPYSVLAGSVHAVYGDDVVVAPGIMTGNTDTRYYWALTRHIFRFGPGYDPDGDKGLGNIHTVDERVSAVGHVNAVKWFTLFVRNMDAADL